MGILDYLTCLLRNLYAGQEATVRTGHGTTDWFQIGKGVPQGCILSPCLFNLYAEYIMRNAGLDEAQAEIKIAGRNINNLRNANDSPLSNKDHGIWSHHFMANRWRNSGNSERLYCLGLQITADGDCSHEIKRCLPLGRKVITNLESILKSRDVTLPTTVCLVKAMVFPVVIYGCESWTIKKAECRRIDAFERWC